MSFNKPFPDEGADALYSKLCVAQNVRAVNVVVNFELFVKESLLLSDYFSRE